MQVSRPHIPYVPVSVVTLSTEVHGKFRVQMLRPPDASLARSVDLAAKLSA